MFFCNYGAGTLSQVVFRFKIWNPHLYENPLFSLKSIDFRWNPWLSNLCHYYMLYPTASANSFLLWTFIYISTSIHRKYIHCFLLCVFTSVHLYADNRCHCFLLCAFIYISTSIHRQYMSLSLTFYIYLHHYIYTQTIHVIVSYTCRNIHVQFQLIAVLLYQCGTVYLEQGL